MKNYYETPVHITHQTVQELLLGMDTPAREKTTSNTGRFPCQLASCWNRQNLLQSCPSRLEPFTGEALCQGTKQEVTQKLSLMEDKQVYPFCVRHI